MLTFRRLARSPLLVLLLSGVLAAQQRVQSPVAETEASGRLQVDRERLAFDMQKARDDGLLENKRYEADKAAKRWSQVATLLPILTLVIGFVLQSGAERRKDRKERQTQRKNETREFIGRQLAELYYPIQKRLQKDDAVWQLWNENQFSEGNRALASTVEAMIILPNHEEIIQTLESNFPLLRNSDEDVNLGQLMQAFMRYEKHVAIYRSLRASGDTRNPIDFGPEWAYPEDLEQQIDSRIQQLESQAQRLAPWARV